MRNPALARQALAVVVAAVLASCVPNLAPTPSATPNGPNRSGSPTAAPQPSPTAAPQSGGTINLLMQNEQFDQVDPQRIYNSEDLAFFGSTVFRSLESYVPDPDPVKGSALQPDLATDLGRPTDGGRTWAFTLRDGVTFQDGSPITCADIKYGVSRTFATDVINQGPTYAVAYLDIPTKADGASSYPGPYGAKPAQQALFDKAIECAADGRTITFHLNRPIADFNYATSLGMSPVPKVADTGETYGLEHPPVSSGPYEITRYKTGNGGTMTLARNPNWNPASDPIRRAYPDNWEVDFAIDPRVLDRRLMDAKGNDSFALLYGTVQTDDLARIFSDDRTPNTAFAGRAISDYDPYARYYWINITKVKNVKVRQAIMVALNRDAIRTILGGPFWGAFADGVLKPTIGIDYAPTGIWDTYFGKVIPVTGDPDLARQLIVESGETLPTLKLDMPATPINEQVAAIVIASLGKAGIRAELAPTGCPPGHYCSIVFDQHPDDFGTGGWGADWPSASTVIPALFTEQGGWDLSHVDDPAFDAAVLDAETTLDRSEQARKWQALNRQAVENAWIVPTFFGLSQTLAGTKVGPIYRWPAYNSWPYGVMFVKP